MIFQNAHLCLLTNPTAMPPSKRCQFGLFCLRGHATGLAGCQVLHAPMPARARSPSLMCGRRRCRHNMPMPACRAAARARAAHPSPAHPCGCHRCRPVCSLMAHHDGWHACGARAMAGELGRGTRGADGECMHRRTGWQPRSTGRA